MLEPSELDGMHWRWRWRAEAMMALKKAGWSLLEIESMEVWQLARALGFDRERPDDDWEMTEADRRRLENFGQEPTVIEEGPVDMTDQIMRQMGINT